jgi:hypothetical protein
MVAREMKLPDWVIIGMQRCGTSSLFVFLCRHPMVHGMTVDPKRTEPNGGDEIHYFDYDKNYARGYSWYMSHARSYDGILGEKSPTYLHCNRAALRMKKIMPDARLLVMLRNPVNRAHSHYWKGRAVGYETLPTFEDALDAEPERLAACKSVDFENSARHLHAYVERGQYVDYLARWKACFDKGQITLIQSEMFFQDPLYVLTKVWQSFGLPVPGGLDQPRQKVQAAKYGAPLKDETRERLEAHFAPYNARLREMTGMPLVGWS